MANKARILNVELSRLAGMAKRDYLEANAEAKKALGVLFKYAGINKTAAKNIRIFLDNAKPWKGERARDVKASLRAYLAEAK